MLQSAVAERDEIIVSQTAFDIFIIVYVSAADNYTSFHFINSFFVFISDSAHGYADHNSDKHIRQSVTDNDINVHQQSVDNKSDKPNNQVLNAERTCFLVLL